MHEHHVSPSAPSLWRCSCKSYTFLITTVIGVLFLIYLKAPPSHLFSSPSFIIRSSSSVPDDVILIQLFIAVADKWRLNGRAEIDKDIVRLSPVSPSVLKWIKKKKPEHFTFAYTTALLNDGCLVLIGQVTVFVYSCYKISDKRSLFRGRTSDQVRERKEQSMWKNGHHGYNVSENGRCLLVLSLT